jgi:hypothetical protein
LVVMSAVGAGIGGVEFAAGVAVSGGLVLANLLVWAFVVRGLLRSAATGEGSALPVLTHVLKFGLLVLTLWWLGGRFPFEAVAMGSSVVVSAILLHAILGLRSELQVGEG